MSMMLPHKSLDNAFISKAAAIGCTFDLFTAVNIGEVESLEYSANEIERKNNLLFGPFSNRTTFLPASSPAYPKKPLRKPAADFEIRFTTKISLPRRLSGISK